MSANYSPVDVAVGQVRHEPYQIIAPWDHMGSNPTGNLPSLRERFAEMLPPKPYCTDNLSHGLLIRTRKRALEYRNISVDLPSSLGWLKFDCDRRDARLAPRDAYLPLPNVVAINPSNGHAHFLYALASPVHRTSVASIKALRYFAAVERGMTRRLGGDPHYGGLICKNPFHPAWAVEWQAPQPYSLAELADWLFPRDMRAPTWDERLLGAGRNCTIFDELRQAAYREVLAFKATGRTSAEFIRRLEEIAHRINGQFVHGLPRSELRAIAKSVAKWTWGRFSVEGFSRVQAGRARRPRKLTLARLAMLEDIADGGSEAQSAPNHSKGTCY